MFNSKENMVMRKVYSFLLAAVATFAAVSCNKEVAPSDNLVEDGVVFTAGFGDETKTTINGEGKSLWEANDKITLHNGTKGYEFTADMAGRFVPFTYAGNDFAGDKFMAVYPAGEYTVDLAAKTVNANIPTWQEARANSWNHNAALAVAYTENDKLYFKNAVALIKFTVMGEKVKNVYFKGNNGEVVSGNVLVTLNADNKVKSVAGTSTEDNVKTAEIYGEPSHDYSFKDNTTYYLAVIPQNFANGFTIQMKMDGVDELKDVVVYDKAYDLKPSTVLNIGVVGTPWCIPGEFNSWSTSETKLTKSGEYFVAKNVTIEGEFKFLLGDVWKGVSTEDAVAVGQWYKLNGENNIKAPAAAAYDVYLTEDGKQFQLVAAGSAAPAAPEVPADYWALIGSFTSWADEFKLVAEGEYLVYKGLEVAATDEFKFRKNGDWDAGQMIAKGGLADADTEYTFVNASSSNMKMSAAGTYDVYVTKDLSKVYFMTAGKTPAQATKPDPTNVYRFYVQNNVGWTTLNFYAWGGYSSAGWPGDSMTASATVEGYGECKYVEVPKGQTVVNFVVNDGSNQTKDLTVSGNSNVKQLANGDYVYVLNSGDLK